MSYDLVFLTLQRNSFRNKSALLVFNIERYPFFLFLSFQKHETSQRMIKQVHLSADPPDYNTRMWEEAKSTFIWSENVIARCQSEWAKVQQSLYLSFLQQTF